MKRLWLFVAILAVTSAHAGQVNNCFNGALPFFQNFTRYTMGALGKSRALETTCQELNHVGMHDARTVGERARGVFISNVSAGVWGQAAAAFSRLQSSEAGRRYMTALNNIKQNPNPLERIRRTYELAVMHSGEYDERELGTPAFWSGLFFGAHRPENLLENARSRGTVGVCREFAALLKWSLLQVSRHPTSQGGALAATDFSSTFMGGYLPGSNGWQNSVGHAWVRINLPVIRDGRLIDFTHFDLDTTWYPRFTILFPRRSGLSATNLERARRECHQILQCLTRF